MESKAMRDLRRMTIFGYVASGIFFVIAVVDLVLLKDMAGAYAAGAAVIAAITGGFHSASQSALAETGGA